MPDLGLLQPFLVTFGLAVGAGLGLPIPEELLIVGAGIWAASADEYGPYRWLMLPVAVVGVVIADSMLYGIGRVYGSRLMGHPWMARVLPERKRQGIEANFERYGISILLFGRLLPAVRTPLFMTAGLMRLPLRSFLLADGLGAVLGNSLLFILAYWFGDAFRDLVERVEKDVNTFRPILIMVAVAAVAGYFLYHFLRKPVSTGDPAELPLIGKQVAARIDHTQPPDAAPAAGAEAPPGSGAASQGVHPAGEGQVSGS